MVYLRDTLVLDKPRRTRDGYLAVRARAARVGVYDYAGFEIDPDNVHGLRDQATVKVLRDDATVFDEAAVRSFIGKPITNDHPKEPVTAANWRDHARGTVMGALRDGDYLAFDLLLTDAETIAAVDSGKRELSNGYGVDLEIGSFTAADGTACQARQSRITGGNHVALVDRGRAGSECAIKDGKPSFAICDAIPADVLARLTSIGDTQMKTLTIDGLIVPNVSDEAAAAITKLQADNAALADKAKAAGDKAVADAATITAKDAEIADLKAKLADAAITPAKLADAAKEYADVQAKAKAAGVTVAADADTAAIKKAVVDAKMGDAAKGYTADHIAIAFDALTKGVKAADQETRIIPYPATQDAAKGATDARRQWLNNKATAYRAAGQA
ncbi:DUF2213 domain-containing protein [Sphingosinicella xenopeptidilytica]|uniref:DUF2213 domain-containing protein n=1 Tax=Sphingosinicella xenopeptidilytica TaxID=364098 RepID=A0ABW3C132_SPHXN